MNTIRQIGKEIHVSLVKYHVYQQIKADEHKASLNMTMLLRGGM